MSDEPFYTPNATPRTSRVALPWRSSNQSRRPRRRARFAPTCFIDRTARASRTFARRGRTRARRQAICKLFHDFRRSAVRTLARSGVTRSTAMAMVGHKTESIYRRYAIMDEAMHREAAAKLDTWNIEQQAKAEVAQGQVRRFKKRQAI
jgi:hypothetical protein